MILSQKAEQFSRWTSGEPFIMLQLCLITWSPWYPTFKTKQFFVVWGASVHVHLWAFRLVYFASFTQWKFLLIQSHGWELCPNSILCCTFLGVPPSQQPNLYKEVVQWIIPRLPSSGGTMGISPCTGNNRLSESFYNNFLALHLGDEIHLQITPLPRIKDTAICAHLAIEKVGIKLLFH